MLQLLRPRGVSRGHELRGAPRASARRCLHAPAPPAAPTSEACRRGSVFRSRSTTPSKWQLREAVETTVRGMPAPHAVARRQKIDRVRRALASGAALAAALGPDDRALRQQADGDGRQRSASRVVAVAGAALARRERQDARLRGAPRDPGDAAHGAQPPGAARDLCLPRGPVAGTARHGSRPLPGARRSKPARVHGIRRRGSQLRVLPPPGAVRPALETIGRGTTDRPARSDWPAHPGGDRLLPSARRDRS